MLLLFTIMILYYLLFCSSCCNCTVTYRNTSTNIDNDINAITNDVNVMNIVTTIVTVMNIDIVRLQ